MTDSNDSDVKQAYLAAMGIQVWESRSKMARTKKSTAEKPVSELTWDELKTRVSQCTLCDLHKTRTQAVFGVGSEQADLLIVGEAPGANEDKQGEPFVGRAGRLLNSMIQAMGLSRPEIYIANVLKSRPPENRDPTPKEVAICTPYLQRQITLLKPKVILALGRIAAHHLLATDDTMGQLRGQQFTYGPENTPLIVTYHPAYLLRAPREKRKSWQDLQQVMKLLKNDSSI